MLTNAEWQMAVIGTPAAPGRPATCTRPHRPRPADVGCTSACGVNDMVGNLWE